jgi:DNA adenine methylase
MKIRGLLPWYGAKRILAPRIVAELGPHRSYWEPFCGSMAVLLAKQVCASETVNDLHGDLINLALVIAHDAWGPWLYRQLRRVLVHQELHRVSKVQINDPKVWRPRRTDPFRLDLADARRAYWYFINSWLGRNGVIGSVNHERGNSFCTRYTVNGGIQGTRFASAVDSIPWWRRRMRRVTVLNQDGLALLERIHDQPGTAIYCDPPYLDKGSAFIHDFAAEDHAALADRLARFHRARVVMSYYDHPRLAKLYPGWTKVRCPLAKSLVNQGQRGQGPKAMAPEVLLVNGGRLS